MIHTQVNKAEHHHHTDAISLHHERRRIRKMRLIFGVFSMTLLLSLVISLLLNR